MGFRKCFYDFTNDTIHLWHTDAGERKYEAVPWVPYVFVSSANSDITTLQGRPVAKKTFRNYRDYQGYQKNNTKNIYENKVKPEIQFLAERYWHIADDELEVPELRKFTIDIETHSDDEFPDPKKAEHPITLITISDSQTKQTYTWGLKPYTGKADFVTNYVYCENEELLIKQSLEFIANNEPDVYTGWFIYGYDLPYIINRCTRLFGEKKAVNIYGFLSPIGITKMWDNKKGETNIDIAGVEILDYISLYKKYSSKHPENYKLNTIANIELGKGKLEYQAKDLRELYHTDWNTYVEYNVIDVVRVVELDEKLGYITLVQSLSLLSKCPMKYYESVTNLIEGVFLTYYRRKGKCAPYHAGGSQEQFEAAYVKEPIIGLHEWVSIVDIISSYPTGMITLNIGNNTFYGITVGLSEDDVLSYVRAREFSPFKLYRDGNIIDISGSNLESFNKAMKKGLFAVAPNGAIFWTNQPGNIAEMEREIFAKRIELKTKMKSENDPIKRGQLNVLQNSCKLILNATYGSLSVPYSRHFNVHIASAITAVGRHTIKQGEKFVDEYLKDRFGVERENVIAIDTDSLQIHLEPYLKEKTIDEIVSISEDMNKVLNKRSYEETQLIDYCSPVKDFKVGFAFEVVARSGLWAAKKQYGCWVVWKEGKLVDQFKIIGLSIIRSDSPDTMRSALKELMSMILKASSDEAIRKKITEFRETFKVLTPLEIARNIGFGGAKDYIIDDESQFTRKGTPHNVKGVASYNKMLKILGLTKKYPVIRAKEKCKVLYLKRNKYGVEELSFTEWPKEFDSHLLVDYDKMIEKTFTKKMAILLTPMNKLELLTDSTDLINQFF